MSQPAELGVIHDIGFRHYDGPRLGRSYLLRSLYTDSLRGAYGLGRSAKSKVMPFLLLTLMLVPALIVAIIASVTHLHKLPFPESQYMIRLALPISVYLASQAPASVSRDLRFRVMPLYFSRPLGRNDYVLAKFAALSSALFILSALPLTVLWVGALLAKLPFWAQTRDYLLAIVGAALLALLLAGIGLLIASITPKRGFGVAAVITVLLVLSVAGGITQHIADLSNNEKLAGYLGVINPFTLVDGVQAWLLKGKPASTFPPLGNLAGAVYLVVLLAVIAGCYALLLLRYRKVSAS